MVLYEAPHRVARTLADLIGVCGEQRRVVLARELTKLHEEVFRGTLVEASARIEETEPRGEFVIVLDGAPAAEEATDDDVLGALDRYRAAGASTRDAVADVAHDLGVAAAGLRAGQPATRARRPGGAVRTKRLRGGPVMAGARSRW